MKHLMACTALCLILGVTFPAEARWSVLQKDETFSRFTGYLIGKSSVEKGTFLWAAVSF